MVSLAAQPPRHVFSATQALSAWHAETWLEQVPPFSAELAQVLQVSPPVVPPLVLPPQLWLLGKQ